MDDVKSLHQAEQDEEQEEEQEAEQDAEPEKKGNAEKQEAEPVKKRKAEEQPAEPEKKKGRGRQVDMQELFQGLMLDNGMILDKENLSCISREPLRFVEVSWVNMCFTILMFIYKHMMCEHKLVLKLCSRGTKVKCVPQMQLRALAEEKRAVGVNQNQGPATCKHR